MVQDEDLWQEHPEWHPTEHGAGRLFIVNGCPAEPQHLERIHIARARAAVILADPIQGGLADAHTTLVSVAIERRNPQVHTVAELIDSVNRVHLRSTEVNEVVCLGELAEHLIAQSCVTPGIAHIFASLLHAHPGTTQLFVLDLPQELVGQTYRQLMRRSIEARARIILFGFVTEVPASSPAAPDCDATPPQPRPVLVLNPRPDATPGRDTTLRNGDRLLVLAYTKPDLKVLI
jgi:hypothetical protein